MNVTFARQIRQRYAPRCVIRRMPQEMNDRDLQTLKENDNRVVRIRTYDGESMIAKVRFVSDLNQDVIYDLVSTTKESQYEKHDEQPAYRIRFEDIESVEATGAL